MRRLVGLVALAAACLGLTGSWAGADTAQQQGWWTAANPGLPGVPLVVGADVPAEGLLVQGGPSSPTAYAALVYGVPEGQGVGPLTLSVAASSVTTPGATLRACPLAEGSFEPSQGGPMTDAPAYDCSRQTTATPNGTSYAFNIASLATDGTLAIAILPTAPGDRVVFDKPGDDSLLALPGPGETAPTPTTTPAVSTPTFGGGGPTFEAPNLPLPAPELSPAAPEPATPALPESPPGFVPTAVSGPPAADPAAVAGYLLCGAVGAGLWLGARRAAVRDALAGA